MRYVAPSGQTPRPLKPLISGWAAIGLVVGGLLLCCAWPSFFFLQLPEGAVKVGLAWAKIGLALMFWIMVVVWLRRKKGGWALTVFGCGVLSLVSGALDQAYLNIIAPLPDAARRDVLYEGVRVDYASDVLFYASLGLLNLKILLELVGDLRAQRLPPKESFRLLAPVGWLAVAGLHLMRGLDDLFNLGRWFF